MSLENIVVNSFLKYLPSFLLKHLCPESKLRKEIEVRGRPEGDQAGFSSQNPASFYFYLMINNKSDLDLELEKLVYEIWYTQPLCNGAYLQTQEIKSKQNKDIYGKIFLSEEQIKKAQEENRKDSKLSLNYKAYFNTKVGKLLKEGQIYLNVKVR